MSVTATYPLVEVPATASTVVIEDSWSLVAPAENAAQPERPANAAADAAAEPARTMLASMLRDRLTVALLLAATLTILSNSIISTGLPGIRAAFSSSAHADLLVPMLVTAPSLLVAVTAPFAGLLADRFGPGRQLMIGVAVFALAGTAGLWLYSLDALMISRLVLGVAVALIMTAQTALVGDHFSGSARADFMGLQLAATNLSGLLAQLGYTSPSGSGMVLASVTLSSGLCSLVYSRVRSLVGRRMLFALGFAFFAAGFGALSLATGLLSALDAAVSTARTAFEERRWLKLPPPQRAKIMFSIADRIEAAIDELAVNETRENGMPIAMARGMVGGCAEVFRYFGGWITKIHGLTSEIAAGDAFHCYTRKEPVGVAALIVPWNGPLIQACRKVAPALAAGCTAVLKPAEDTSLNTLHLARIFLEAGVPPGVINIVTGIGSVVGQALAEHPDVDKISFTGSTAVGRRIVQAASGNFKRVTLELGGKSPVIVLDDADLALAAPSILRGIMGNAGQACVAGSRLYAQRGIYDRLLDALADAASKMVVGDGLNEATQMGPVISARQMDRVLGYIDSGVADGAEMLTGGKRRGDRGFFVEPTILSHTPADAKVVREEIFGPVLSAMPFDDVEDAIRRANDSRYGLAGAVYTRSLGHAHCVAKAIQAGYVWVNTHHVMDSSLPFGGYKESGWGREDGAQGLDGYLETKTVVARLN